MSREQANTFKKFRDADDAMGNLGWASKMAKNAVCQAPEAPDDIEGTFGFTEAERVLWVLMRIPRRYSDIETCGVLPAEKVRGILRGLVAADVLDMRDSADAKNLLPLEINRAKKSVKGVAPTRPPSKRKAINERVFRPDIGLSGEGAPEGPPPPTHQGTTTQPAPAAVDFGASVKTPPPTPTGERGPLDAKTWSIKKRILEAHEKLARQNHYAFLGVRTDAALPDIRKAYVELARDYHPDVIAGTELADDEDTKERLAALFKRLQEANKVLSDATSRMDYDAKLKSGASTAPTEGKKVRRPAEARVMAKKGDTFFTRKDYANAEKHFRTAVSLDEEDPLLLTKLAWCIYLNPDRKEAERIADAQKRLKELVFQHKHGDAAYKLGLIARNQGDEREATKQMRDCLRLDPRHAEARQEKRLREMRERKRQDDAPAAKSDKGGLFGRFKK